MARFRLKSCITLIALALLLLIITLALKALTPEDSPFESPGEIKVNLYRQTASQNLRDYNKSPEETKMKDPAESDKDAELESTLRKFPPPNYYLHAFYYIWYGNPKFDGKYIHWDHPQLPHWDAKVAQEYPQGRHKPPDDIGANYYPSLGAVQFQGPLCFGGTYAAATYSSHWRRRCFLVSPSTKDDNGEPIDEIMPSLLELAQKYHIKVAFHIEPYKGRDEVNMFTNVKYIIEKYGEHPAFFKYRTNNGKLLPLFYVYDSYLMNSEQWAKLLKHTDSSSIRDTRYDAIFIALLVEEKHKREILTAGFDGLYTYFATNGFAYGSTQRNWVSIKAFCDDNDLIFIPSVGPGYIDTSVRPWNFKNTRNRINGKYYETSLSAAMESRPDFISITSFNEWHEGTQIEMAIPKTGQTVYLDYLPNKPTIYLEITRKWAAIFGGERQRWQD